MIRLWIGTALLAGSWLLGLDYFYPASPWAWFATVAAAVVLLSKTDRTEAACRASQPSLEAVALVLLLPVVWYASWPYRAAPLLIAAGTGAPPAADSAKRWADGLAHGAMTAGRGVVRSGAGVGAVRQPHRLVARFALAAARLLAGIASLLGIDATASGSSVVMHSMRQVHRLGATWELLLDPATLLFFVGGLTMLALQKGKDEGGMRNDEGLGTTMRKWPVQQLHVSHSSFLTSSFLRPWSAWIRGFRTLSLIVLCWLPLRAGLMMAVYLQRVLRSDPDRPLHAMNHFFSPWMLLALLIPAGVAGMAIRRDERE